MRYTVQIIAKGNHGFAYVNDAETGDVAKAFTGPDAATQADAWADGANGEPAEADEIIHSWTCDSAPAACGVDILRTPYTYGSPELAQVTCNPCRVAYDRYATELTTELSKFARCEEPYPFFKVDERADPRGLYLGIGHVAPATIARAYDEALAEQAKRNTAVVAEPGFRVSDRVVFGADVWVVSSLRESNGRPALRLIDPANPSRWTSVYESTAVEWAETEAHREYAARIFKAEDVIQVGVLDGGALIGPIRENWLNGSISYQTALDEIMTAYVVTRDGAIDLLCEHPLAAVTEGC